MTLPWTEQWYEMVRGWRIRRLRPVLPYYRAVLRASYTHHATWRKREDWATDFGCDDRTVTRWNRALRDYYLLECGFEKQTPTGEPARNDNGVYIVRPVEPIAAKSILDEHGPVTHATEKKSRRRKRKRNLDKDVQVNESGTTTEQAPLDASEIVNLDKDVYREVLPSVKGSSCGSSSSYQNRIAEAVFSAQTTPAVQAPTPARNSMLIDAQKKLVDATAADYAYIISREDYSIDDREKVLRAVHYLREVEIYRGRFRTPPRAVEAQENYDEVSTTPLLNSLLVEVLNRDTVPIKSPPPPTSTPVPLPVPPPPPPPLPVSGTWKEAVKRMHDRGVSTYSAERQLGKYLQAASIEEIDALGREEACA